MSVIAGQTRLQLRQTIGYAMGAVRVSTTTSAGSTTTFEDDTLENADDYYNGQWFVNDDNGEIAIVEDYAGSTKIGTFRTAITSVGSGVDYSLFAPDMPPDRIHDAINRAIRTVTRRGAPPVTDLSLHSSLHQRVYAVPTSVAGIERIEYRAWHKYKTLHSCDAVWDETVDADTTATADTEDRREGSASNKFVIAAGMSAGDLIATADITSVDLSGYTHIEGWIKSTVATSAGDLVLHLDDTASCASPLESLNIPALVADTWTWFRVALANPESDTAIISIGLENNVDIGAATIHIDGLEATLAGSEYWEPVHRSFWRIDRDRREVVFRDEAVQQMRHSLIKLVGRKKPTELTSDSTTCDVSPDYIVNRACALLMRARGDRRAESRQAAHQEADRFEQLAEVAYARMQIPGSVRWVDD